MSASAPRRKAGAKRKPRPRPAPNKRKRPRRNRHAPKPPTPTPTRQTYRKPQRGTSDPYLWAEKRINGDRYLVEMAAQEFIGRSRVTLWDWRRQGLVIARQCRFPDGSKHWLYHAGSLRAAKRETDRRKRDQLRVGGSGRGHRGRRSKIELARARADAQRRRDERNAEKAARRRAMREAAEAAERAEDELYARQNEGS